MLQGECSAILSTLIKLLFVIKIFVLSMFKWVLKTGFTVFLYISSYMQGFLWSVFQNEKEKSLKRLSDMQNSPDHRAPGNYLSISH